MKRLLDVVVSAFGLILLMPLFVAVAAWIRWDSKGPVFYRQQRVGRHGVDFTLYKFRSMRPNSDRCGLITVGDRDPRVTRSGYYLRKYKLDELPQLINVLIGDMSIVGPRPEVRRYVEMYTPEQCRVLSVKPGITDVASIKYRNESELLAQSADAEQLYIRHILPDKIAMNLQYAANSSVFMDIVIIVRTCTAVIFNR